MLGWQIFHLLPHTQISYEYGLTQKKSHTWGQRQNFYEHLKIGSQGKGFSETGSMSRIHYVKILTKRLWASVKSEPSIEWPK